MKRPFAAVCVLLAALAVMKYAADGRARIRPLHETVNLLREESEKGGEITVEGTVAKCSAVSSGIRLSVNHLTIQRNDNSEQSLFPGLNILITTENTKFLPGDTVVASGKAVFWEPASNPGQFDAQRYYFSQDTVCSLSRAVIRETVPGRMRPARMLELVRRRLRASYEAILEERQAKTMEAICLGERGLLEQEWKQFYQEGGISHILAISGLHISLVGMCLYRLLRRLGVPFGGSCALSGASVIFYVLMTGAGVSAVRALIMFGLWLGAQLCGRKYDMATAIAAAAMLILFGDAGSLSQSSFLLSFGAVLSIALLLPCLRTVCTGADTERRRQSLSQLLLPGAAVWLGTLPVTLYFFYQAVPWSILINLAVVPLMSVVMVCGLLAAVAGLVSVPAGSFLAAPAHYILEGFDFLCRVKEQLPGSVCVMGRPAAWRIALYYGILFGTAAVSYRLAVRRRKRRTAERRSGCRKGTGEIRRIREILCHCLLWTACTVSCVALMGVRGHDRLSVVCLDAGQGDAALLRLPGGVTCLVDGGSTSEADLWRYRLSQTVKYYGVRTLDYIFLSHADEDHISGIREYLQEYRPGFAGENVHGVTLRNLVFPPTADPGDFQELCALAQDRGIQVLRMGAGGVIGSAEMAAKAQEDADEDADEDGEENGEENREENGKENGEENGEENGKGSREASSSEIDGELWSITCLAPDAGRLTGDRNEDSMVLMLQYGAFRMLFTGDLEGGAERRLAASGEILSADILKVGHHGSGNASSREFLGQVSPQIAVISCGAHNPYGHPAPETLERLQETGCRVLETPEGGAVLIESDGTTYSAETYNT